MIFKLKTERGLALQDLLTGAYHYLETIELPPHARIYLLDHFATTEYVFFALKKLAANNDDRHRLASGGNEKMQLTALLGAFKNAVELAAKSSWLPTNRWLLYLPAQSGSYPTGDTSARPTYLQSQPLIEIWQPFRFFCLFQLLSPSIWDSFPPLQIHTHPNLDMSGYPIDLIVIRQCT